MIGLLISLYLSIGLVSALSNDNEFDDDYTRLVKGLARTLFWPLVILMN